MLDRGKKRAHPLTPKEVDEMLAQLQAAAPKIPYIPFPQPYLNMYFKEAERLGVRTGNTLPSYTAPRCLNPQCVWSAGHGFDCDGIPF